MKTKLLILTAIAALGVTTPAFAKHRVVQTRNGRAVVVNTHRYDSRSSHVFWNVGIGFPFYGGYYGGYPYYGGYSSGYPYYGSSYYYGGYPYGYTTPTTAPVIRTLTTDIPIGTTTIQS
jgi:hypothetical protein